MVAPLDWGLGHATRCIPIIQYLIEKGAEVIVAADNRPLALLENELGNSGVEFLRFPGYDIRYPGNGSMAVKMLVSAPRILRGISGEHSRLDRLIKEHNIHAVISDNRFGLWSRQVPCIFITHQLMIKSPFGEGLLHKLNSRYIGKYDECWIPDVEGESNLSGDLSHKYALPSNAYYIGPLTRFEKHSARSGGSRKSSYDILAIISGPEPQRTLFETIITAQAQSSPFKTFIAAGAPERPMYKETTGAVTGVPHLETEELHNVISSSAVVISRPGYSTVMDLAALGKKAIFVPTPGQTEQEYLGAMLMKKGIAYCVSQDKFNLPEALKESENYKGFGKTSGIGRYRDRVDALLERL
jgi:predicted glycosyltransferase